MDFESDVKIGLLEATESSLIFIKSLERIKREDLDHDDFIISLDKEFISLQERTIKAFEEKISRLKESIERVQDNIEKIENKR